MLWLARTLNGLTLKGLDGDIGAVNNLYFDDRHWVVRYLIVETGSWFSSREVLISPYALSSVDVIDQEIAVNMTKRRIAASPSVDTQLPVSRQFEIDYSEYYGFPYYWTGMNAWGDYPYMWGGYPYALPAMRLDAPAPVQDNADHHLRSMQEVRGYHVHASDGEIGHIEDFVIDDKNWSVSSLLIATANWWAGKRVLLSPQSIEEVRWEDAIVVINQTRAQIKNGQEYAGKLDATETCSSTSQASSFESKACL